MDKKQTVFQSSIRIEVVSIKFYVIAFIHKKGNQEHKKHFSADGCESHSLVLDNFGKSLFFFFIWQPMWCAMHDVAVKFVAGSFKAPELLWDVTPPFSSGSLQIYWMKSR